jgi:hypothetical protein
MRAIYSFSCDAGHITEKFIDSETNEIECPVCQATAKKFITPVRVKGDKNSWKEVQKWTKKREAHARYEKKQGVK